MSPLSISRRSLLAGFGASALVMAGCAKDEKPAVDATPAASGSAGTADAPALQTVTPGVLTIATGEPAYSPWVEDDNPESGKGFEAAVAYAVAEKMGFDKANVKWVRTTFDSAIAPGAKDWDFNLQQFSVTEERRKAVDFSSPYYTTMQAVVTLEGSKAAKATSLAELKDVLFGVQAGTTSQQILEKNVEGAKEPLVFNSSQDTVQALKGGQVDAIITDLPTALYLVAAELDNGTIVGQFPDTDGGDDLALVLPKGSPLTPAVTEAVDALRADGTLEKLQKAWLADSINAPVLK